MFSTCIVVYHQSLFLEYLNKVQTWGDNTGTDNIALPILQLYIFSWLQRVSSMLNSKLSKIEIYSIFYFITSCVITYVIT